MFYILTKFHHGWRRALPHPHGCKNQGPDGDVGDPPPQEQGRRLHLQRRKHAPHTNQARPREAVVRRLCRLNEWTGNVSNALNDYKSTVHIKNRDVLAASRAAAERASTNDSTVEPEIDNNSNA